MKSLLSQSPLLSGLFSLTSDNCFRCPRAPVAIPFVVGAIFPRSPSSCWLMSWTSRNPLCCRGYFPSHPHGGCSVARPRRNPLCCRGYFPSAPRTGPAVARPARPRLANPLNGGPNRVGQAYKSVRSPRQTVDFPGKSAISRPPRSFIGKIQ